MMSGKSNRVAGGPPCPQLLIGHAGLCRQGSGEMPRPLAAECRKYGLSFGGSQFKQVADFGTGISPLFPVTHPYPATEPFIYLRDGPVVLRCSSSPRLPCMTLDISFLVCFLGFVSHLGQTRQLHNPGYMLFLSVGS